MKNYKEREILEEYDLFNAAYCFAMPDIEEALEKMFSCANVIFLVTFAGSSLSSVFPFIIPGYNPPPDYIYLYNVLYQMGVKANVKSTPGATFIPGNFCRSSWSMITTSPRKEKKWPWRILKRMTCLSIGKEICGSDAGTKMP